jgi:hypothetical protein
MKPAAGPRQPTSIAVCAQQPHIARPTPAAEHWKPCAADDLFLRDVPSRTQDNRLKYREVNR